MTPSVLTGLTMASAVAARMFPVVSVMGMDERIVREARVASAEINAWWRSVKDLLNEVVRHAPAGGDHRSRRPT